MLERGSIRQPTSGDSVRRSRARLLSGLAALSAASALLALPVVSAQAAHRAAKRPAVRGSVTVDYIVPTRDAKLFLEVVHPTDAAGHIIPAPVILTYTPYAVLGRNGDAD